jgi:xylulokinase
VRTDAVLGVDIGTSSSKGVLVALDGRILATAVREHAVSRPAPGQVEMPAGVWWDEFASISRELLASDTGGRVQVTSVGVSGMGPCVLVADGDGVPLRPAILYGVDTRAVEQIAELTAEFGEQAIVDRCGSALSTQAAGPKLAWIARHEPEVAARARRLFMPSSFLAFQLTGDYVLDHHSASQCTPLYDTAAHEWFEPWATRVTEGLGTATGDGFDLPRLVWPGDVVGRVGAEASAVTGLPAGIPVIAGTIDAWSEALSVGAHGVGDLMLMYGTTMFLVNTVEQRVTSDTLWGTVGAYPGTYNLAGGMATSGAITGWLRTLFGSPGYSELLTDAEASGPGSNGVLMLPYFAGERTPIADPDARGTIAGLSLDTTRGDLYRAALEATAFGVRHNVEAFRALGGSVLRTVAVGGGTQGGLWTQIVSDVTGLEQVVPTVTIGASFGAAFLAASAVASVSIADWNPPATIVRPRPEFVALYDDLFALYRDFYPATAALTHALVAHAH